MSESSGLSRSPSADLIVDAWPVLEWLKDREPAATVFGHMLDQADANRLRLDICSVNLGEVFYSFAKEYSLQRSEQMLARFQTSPVRVVEADTDLVFAAARLKAKYPISYADAFGAALSIRSGAPFLTGDEDFLKLEAAGLLRLRWIGKARQIS